MKNAFKRLAIAVLIFSSSLCRAQYVTLPDPAFTNFLFNGGLASCFNASMQLDTTCQDLLNYTNFGVSDMAITDITGIRYFKNITQLTVSNTSVASMQEFPDGITYLEVTGNSALTSISNLPPLLTSLNVYNNQLASLPPLPASLLHLTGSRNQMSILPMLPPGLIHLEVGTNQLTSLPLLPSTLERLSCEQNQLTALPALPASLTQLNCFSNQITSLPSLPAILKLLDFGYNPISVLSYIPDSATLISCQYTLVSSLPALPDSVDQMSISHTNISCLPVNRVINYLDWDSTQIKCMPQDGQVLNSNPPYYYLLPLCQPSNDCPFGNIMGHIFNDVNGNCVNDGETFLQNIPVRLDSAGIFVQEVLTSSQGYYSFRAAPGIYTVYIDVADIPFNVVCPIATSYTSVLTSTNANDSLLDFGLQCKAGFDLSVSNVTPSTPFRPWALPVLYVSAGDVAMFNGVSCNTAISGTVEVTFNGPVSYLSPAPGAVAPTSVNGNIVTWNVNDFSASNPLTDFNIVLAVDTTATVGDSVCVQANITPVNGDNDVLNNVLSACYPVLNSFDPNEKFMSPSGAVDSSQQWFTFTVFFQNTGNAAAEDIYILDPLDANLDAYTFTYLASSHDVITQLLPGNILRFNYANINLPDSNSNEPASHGFVQFKVKRKQGLPVGTTISNTAFIYFDYNSAIVTNTVTGTLTVPSMIKEMPFNEFTIAPNPTTGIVKLHSNYPLSQIEVVNVLGEKVWQSKLAGGVYNTKLNLSFLPKGIYFINAGSINRRFVKL